MWTPMYCNTSHYQGQTSPRIQITVVDRGSFAEVTRLDLDAKRREFRREPGTAPGGVFTATHEAMRKTVAAAKAVGEAWARGDFSAPSRLKD